jgi:hypothetical protein
VSLEGIRQFRGWCLQKVKPSKATVEFGVEISAESGNLTTLIVKGGGKVHLNITLEWSGQTL